MNKYHRSATFLKVNNGNSFKFAKGNGNCYCKRALILKSIQGD